MKLRAMRILRNLVRGLALSAVSLCVALLLLEIVLRFLPVSQGTRRARVDEQHPVPRLEPSRDFTYSVGAQFQIHARKRTNAEGFVHPEEYTRDDPRPLVAVVGDSCVEACHVPEGAPLTERIGALWPDRLRSYAFGIGGAQLPTYLVLADYARREFRPGFMVFVILANDYEESYLPSPATYVFDEHSGERKRCDYHPSRMRNLVRQSALVRYVLLNLSSLGLRVRLESLAEKAWQPALSQVRNVGYTSNDASQEHLARATRAIHLFFEQLPAAAGLSPERILFVMDAMRPNIYDAGELAAAQGTYCDIMRQRFASEAAVRGYEVVDLQPAMIAEFARTGQRFEWAIDGHWNSRGHALAAEQVVASGAFRAFGASIGVVSRGGP